ncbi:nitroreductase family protein [Streptomyces reniochalinae]|uniref:Nitroreductase family protein n=1 Tax=Streptomyces reniochalinae TaxID=2250578 RepID=A0A367EBL7_9ACTN|nr:nitroreductase family protein [Streptomyces reniochalinae]RCG15373.1 nitroreductase family protein [Streptomyces reniochalinae]
MVHTTQSDPGPARHPTVPLRPMRVTAQQAEERAEAFHALMERRRTVRDFDHRPLPEGVLEWAVRTASTAPSGAHVQPWRFVVLTDPERKRRLREAAEAEEREFYGRRASDEWLTALAPLGTDAHKPFLETAPAVIVVFEVHKGPHTPRPYYTKESVGIAVGFLLATLHQAGLATLTHTPSPMRFLNEVCERPAEERGAYVIPVGYPAPDARVPDLRRKPLEEVMIVL